VAGRRGRRARCPIIPGLRAARLAARHERCNVARGARADRARGGETALDIDLIASRLIATVDWLGRQPALRELSVGCFGASTGGAASLISAARRPDRVRAVVSRGGRVDLAGRWLAAVKAPTLLVVGAKDIDVLAINQHALRELKVEKRMEVVGGATHLFDEPGALEEVSRIAASWFLTFLR
jgi:putative phosphoribosyl transferase